MKVEYVLPGWLPVTAIVGILVFVTREFLEWRRRRSSEVRKIKALKKIIVRECGKNNITIEHTTWALEKLQLALAEGNRNRTTVASNGNAELMVTFRVDATRTMIWPTGSVHREALLKHLLEIAALDETFFEACVRCIDSLENLAPIFAMLKEHAQKGWGAAETGHHYLLLDRYIRDLGEVKAVNASLHQICAGSPMTPIERPNFEPS